MDDKKSISRCVDALSFAHLTADGLCELSELIIDELSKIDQECPRAQKLSDIMMTVKASSWAISRECSDALDSLENTAKEADHEP